MTGSSLLHHCDSWMNTDDAISSNRPLAVACRTVANPARRIGSYTPMRKDFSRQVSRDAIRIDEIRIFDVYPRRWVSEGLETTWKQLPHLDHAFFFSRDPILQVPPCCVCYYLFSAMGRFSLSDPNFTRRRIWYGSFWPLAEREGDSNVVENWSNGIWAFAFV